MRVGQDVATPASVPPSAPRLNLDLPRSPRPGETSAAGSKGVFQLLPRPPETKSKLEKELDKAGRPDCRNAYAGAGLLAAVPLVVDAVRDKGCRW